MRIAVGSDHAGFSLKRHLAAVLAAQGHTIEDAGTHGPGSVDYPEFARAVAGAVAGGTADLGILVCGSGIGMSITANRVRGIRAARCTSEYDARLARAHNDANVLCLGERVTGVGLAEAIVAAFLDGAFEGGRHQRRIARIDEA